MLKMTLVLEGERQKRLCLGKETGKRGTGFPGRWEDGVLKDMEFTDRFYHEDLHEQTRERPDNFSLFSLCYSAGLWLTS